MRFLCWCSFCSKILIYAAPRSTADGRGEKQGKHCRLKHVEVMTIIKPLFITFLEWSRRTFSGPAATALVFIPHIFAISKNAKRLMTISHLLMEVKKLWLQVTFGHRGERRFRQRWEPGKTKCKTWKCCHGNGQITSCFSGLRYIIKCVFPRVKVFALVFFCEVNISCFFYPVFFPD